MFVEKGCSLEVATLLTRLTTFENQLPQGPCTSPALANQVLTPLAKRMMGVCIQHGLTMTIYGDDISVSGPTRAAQVEKLLNRIVVSEGYSLNLKKSGVRKANQRQVVTGITVNQKINVQKDKYRRCRAMLHAAEHKGFDNVFPGLSAAHALQKLEGTIAHIARLNPKKGEHLHQKLASIRGKVPGVAAPC
jgi:retron-type reverse transcriptase